MQTQAPSTVPARPSREQALPEREARRLLSRSGDEVPGDAAADAVATRLMDLFRRSGDAEAFDCLVRLTSAQLLQRIRARSRHLGPRVDAEETLQDVIINIFRYPDRFDASRPGAFRAWSSTIVDNTIRRQLRKGRRGAEIILRSSDLLAQEPDLIHADPGGQAIQRESYRQTARAYGLLLAVYLEAFQTLSERERFVLQMVEVRKTRYAQLAGILGIRAEALKMVVFRARKRIQERMAALLRRAGHGVVRPSAVGALALAS